MIACCLLVIRLYTKIWYAYVKEQRHLARLKSMVKIFFMLRSKVKVINVLDTLYHGDTLTCQTKYDYVKGQKSLVLNTKQCHKPYKFDLEVKGEHRIRVINVLDLSSHGDTVCQI